MNTFRTGILMAGLTALFCAVGFLIAGPNGMAIAFVMAAGSNLFAYWNSDRVVLSLYGATPAPEGSDVVHIVRQLSERAGLPMPAVYIIGNPQPNAFATGRSPEHAAVCVTTGLMAQIDNQELAGVLAHELSHIKHRDTLTMTITATMAGAISMLANFALFAGMWGGNRQERDDGVSPMAGLLIAMLAPMAAMIVQMAISRTREFEADREGAEISGRPLWLASALERIEAKAEVIANPQADANPATAHMFIINPLHGGGLQSLFSSHPSTEERVARLRTMAVAMGQAAPLKSPWA